MGVPVPITRSADFSAGYSTHLYQPIPPAGTPAPTYAIEIPLSQAWPVGVALGSVKKTSTVVSNGLTIMLGGHDCGKFIPQITVPVNNALLPTLPMSSRRSVVMSSFSVRMNGSQVACTSLWPPLPMLACGQPMPIPLTFTLSNVLHSVFVGLSVADFVGGVIKTAGTMAVEYVFFDPAGAKLSSADEMRKELLMASVSLAASDVQHLIDPRYPLATSVTVKGPEGLNYKVSVSCGSSDTTNNPSQISLGVEKTLTEHKPTGSQTKGSYTVTHTWDAGDNKAKEGTKAQLALKSSTPVGSASESATVDMPNAGPAKVTMERTSTTILGNSSKETQTIPLSKIPGLWGPPL